MGAFILTGVCAIKFLFAIPRLFTEDWTWNELLVFPFQVLVLGFLTGAVHGLLFPLARYGRIGAAIIGAACANMYLLVCFALFETEALLHPRLDTTLALGGIATVAGGALGVMVRKDIREVQQAEQADELECPPDNGEADSVWSQRE